MIRHTFISGAVALFAAISCGSVFAQSVPGGSCGESLANGYGPYDYRVQKGVTLETVEKYHFTPRVENLMSGESATVGADLDYTLHAFPNHHRALLAMAKLGDRLKTNQPPGAKFIVECYFERAVRFQAQDTVARGLYAQFLQRKGRKADAVAQMDIAAGYAKENPFSTYNIGLLYFEAGEYDKALTQAHLAQEMGFPRTELMDMLKQANKWTDAPAK